MALCRLIDKIAYGGESQFDRTAIGFLLLTSSGAAWVGTLFVVVPLQVFFERKRRQKVMDHWASGDIDPERMTPIQQHLFYANYGSLPRWLYLPFVIVLAGLVSILAMVVTIGFIQLLVKTVVRLVGN